MARIDTYIIERNITGCATDEEQAILHQWLARAESNRDAYSRMKNIWDSCRIKSYSQDDIHREWELLSKRIDAKTVQSRTTSRIHRPEPRRVITLSYRWAAAAVLLAIIGGAMLHSWMQKQMEEISTVATAYQEINVPYGARSKILLPDGSRITLNAGTKLRYGIDFGKSNRDLWLDGEAFFVVKKSVTPFVVHSGTVKIKALGTQFNVKAYASENKIETTLVEGKVAVTDTNVPEHHQEVTLLPNQKLIVDRDGNREKIVPANKANEKNNAAQPAEIAVQEMVKQENIDPLPDISWKDNEWVIYRESLGSLAVKLERRFDVKISFRDENIRAFRYNGTLPDESLEQVLNVITLASPDIKYSVKGKTVVFSENKQVNVRK